MDWERRYIIIKAIYTATENERFSHSYTVQ